MRIESTVSPYISPETLTSLQKITLRPPQVALSDIEPTPREISPLFLRKTPYNSSDPFITKCIKSISATLMLASYLRQETRALMAFLPLAPQVNAEVQAAKEHLENTICQLYYSNIDAGFILEFEKEKLKVLKGETQEIPKEELIGAFLDSYTAMLKARDSTFENGKKVTYTKETRAEMIDAYEVHLENTFNRLNSNDNQTIEEVKENVAAFEALGEKLFDARIALNETVSDLNIFLTSPLLI